MLPVLHSLDQHILPLLSIDLIIRFTAVQCFSVGWEENFAIIIVTAHVMSGLETTDRYNKFPTADWYFC